MARERDAGGTRGGGRRSRRLAALVLCGAAPWLGAACGCAGEDGAGAGPEVRAALEADLRSLVDSSGRQVAVYYRTLRGDDSLLLSPDLRMHAASTMKVPVMMRLFRDRDAGRLSLDDALEVRTRFTSIADGSTYELDPSSDSDTTLYGRAGEPVPLRELVELMITVSSNLATNLLVEEVGPQRVTALLRELGADSMEVLRGVEDIPAFRAGMSNTTTARDLGIVFARLGERAEAGDPSAREMLQILSRQEHRTRIPALLPPGVRVAHKTGRITEISHDAGIVRPPGAQAYAVVILTRGFRDGEAADRIAARISRRVYDYHVARHSATGRDG